MNNNQLIWSVLGTVVAVIVLVAGTMAYLDKSRQASEMENKVQLLQTEQSALRQQLEAKDKEIKDLEKEKSESQRKTADFSRRIGEAEQKNIRYRNDLDTLGKCLGGTVGLLDAIFNGNQAQALAAAGAMKDPCNKSGTILDKLKYEEKGTNTYYSASQE